MSEYVRLQLANKELSEAVREADTGGAEAERRLVIATGKATQAILEALLMSDFMIRQVLS